MKVIVVGNGFLGSEFADNGYTVWGRDEFDLNNIKSDTTWYKSLRKLVDYDVVVNCIGISDTRYCEERDAIGGFSHALSVNGEIPKVLSGWCKANGKKFVHISTGCLYDESHRPCTEEDFLVAHCGYTVSKYVGEMGCDPSRDLIIRPRLLFSDKKRKGNNLITKLCGFTRFVDEFNSVTWNKTIVEAVEALLRYEQVGVFNVANEGVYTIYEIAQMMHLGGEKMSATELRESQGLYLVNNVMDISKLKQFYNPPTVGSAILECYRKLRKDM